MRDINVTELARKLKIPTKDLLERLPEMGYSIGARAIKINGKMAQEIIEKWSVLNKMYEGKLKLAQEERVKGMKSGKEVKITKTVQIPEFITVREFSERLEMPVPTVIQALMKNGIFASLNERIDFDTAEILGDDLEVNIVKDEVTDTDESSAKEEVITDIMDGEKEKQPRPPVVVVMGHVDHGKTKLLDAIREADVVAGEAGGITQHIGAYQVTKSGKKLTFIDTPGHEAFTAMRSRGARIADVAILVVAADDSVKPQTIEALRIIEQSGLPIIVAINKIDKPDANIDRVKSDLAQNNLNPEEWGGKTPVVEVSALKNTGIEDLLEMILLVSGEHEDEIQANAKGQVVGTVIESHVDKGEGPVSTVLVQNGTLTPGNYIGIAGTLYGRVRAMKDWNGADLKSAKPSTPVKILGFKLAPKVGDIVVISDSQKDLKKKIAFQDIVREHIASPLQVSKTDDDEDDSIKKFNLVIKTDMLGSLEAIGESLEKIHHPEIKLKVASKGLGNITEGDVLQAESAKALLVGFHVKPTPNAEKLARDKGVEIKEYKVIYDLLNDVKEKLNTLLGDEVIETETGELELLAVFNKIEGGYICGGKVTSGRVIVNGKIKVLREGVDLGEGTIKTLQSAKLVVTDVEQGNECGMEVLTKVPIEVGDVFKVYKLVTKDKNLSE